jgi:prevent-host-death family protein
MMSSQAVEQIDGGEAAGNLSRIIARVERGEEIMVSQAGTPVAKLVPVTPSASRRSRGSLRGEIVMLEILGDCGPSRHHAPPA